MTEALNEIRLALVLYGGVSLAIYENGVVRCFHDLVRKQGVFSLLLELLDADATVDVVAGTSAGGIVPPPKTTISSACRSLSSSKTRLNNTLCAPESRDNPIAATSS